MEKVEKVEKVEKAEKERTEKLRSASGPPEPWLETSAWSQPVRQRQASPRPGFLNQVRQQRTRLGMARKGRKVEKEKWSSKVEMESFQMRMRWRTPMWQSWGTKPPRLQAPKLSLDSPCEVRTGGPMNTGDLTYQAEIMVPQDPQS